jgi:hypothetical protein
MTESSFPILSNFPLLVILSETIVQFAQAKTPGNVAGVECYWSTAADPANHC